MEPGGEGQGRGGQGVHQARGEPGIGRGVPLLEQTQITQLEVQSYRCQCIVESQGMYRVTGQRDQGRLHSVMENRVVKPCPLTSGETSEVTRMGIFHPGSLAGFLCWTWDTMNGASCSLSAAQLDDTSTPWD